MDRSIEVRGAPAPLPEGPLRLRFMSPVDVTGMKADPLDAPAALLSRLLRRVDAMARWNGLALTPDALGTLTRNLAGLRVDGAGLTRGWYDSPNRHKQARSGPTIFGWISIHGVTPEIAAVFTLGPRCHLGRHAAEGLGAFSVDLLE